MINRGEYMKYDELIKKLESVNINSCYPIFIPSVLRPNHFFYKNVFPYLGNLKDRVTYFVRPNEYKLYKKAQPDVNIEVIPQEIITESFGLDSTRGYLQRFAWEHRVRRYFDIDDDVSYVSMAYGYEDKNTRQLRKSDREKYTANIFALASEISTKVFKTYENSAMGSFSRITPSTCSKDYHRSMVIFNSMAVPRQLNIVDVKRMKKFGAWRTGKWDSIGEDIGICSELISSNADVFQLPCFLLDTPGVEKNERTEMKIQKKSCAELWKISLDHLRKLSTFEYLTYIQRQATDYQKVPQGLRWSKLHKDRGTKPIKLGWDDYV